ncbi:MAG: hypothetical protein Q7S19_02145 [bacterium]|nr:hypothetical protein [bacterium]
MNNIEAEIAELSAKIAEKRRELEAGKGIVEERELVKSVIGEKISNTVPQASSIASDAASIAVKSSTTGASVPAGKSYLDYLDEESRAIIDGLVESVFANGLEKTLKGLEMQEPYIIDVFHDVLTDKIYEELKKRGTI